MDNMHLWRIEWFDGTIQYLRGSCLADAVDRGGRYRVDAVSKYEQVD